MLQVIAATRNPEKAAALRGMLAGLATVSVLSRDISLEHFETNANSSTAIAIAKSRESSRQLMDRAIDEVVVATDGGLLLPGLGKSWDPTRTRRFAGQGARPGEIAARLIDRASGLAGEERRIGWVEALAVARHGELLAHFVAESPAGLLATSIDERLLGLEDGFWVPYVWRCPEYAGKLLVDLTSEERAERDDHWDRLGRQARAYLVSFDEAERAATVGF